MSCLFLLDVYGRDRKRLCESWRDRELCVCLLLELLGSKQQQQQQQQPFNQKLNLIKNVDKVSGEKYFANDEILILLNRFPFYFSFYVMISPPPEPDPICIPLQQRPSNQGGGGDEHEQESSIVPFPVEMIGRST